MSCSCSILFGSTQKPLSESKPLKTRNWIQIFQLSIFQIFILFLFFHGLSQVGPYRTVLLTAHSEIVVVTVFSAILQGRCRSIMYSNI